MVKKYLLTAIVVILLLIGAGILFNYSPDKKSGNIIESPEEEKQSLSNPEFIGENGEEVFLIDKQVKLDSKIFADGLAHYYNTEPPDEREIYFFVLKDKNGVYRAAANACQVCFDARMGFRQEGDFMVCNTCGNKYPLTKIATEKGGCNPGPINPNLEVKEGKVIIEQSDLEQVAEFF